MIQLLMILYVLACLDSAFSGICAASGRNSLIEKRVYWMRAMAYGFAWGQVACLVAFALLAVVVGLSEDRAKTVEEMTVVGQRMADVYVVYAAIVLGTFAIRAVPSVDVRSMTSVVGFGPLTMLRPFIILAGLAWGLAAMPSAGVAFAASAITCMMLPFRRMLNALLDRHGIGILKPGVPRGSASRV